MRVFLFAFFLAVVFGLPGAVAQTVSKEKFRKFDKRNGVQPIVSNGRSSVYDGIITAQAQANDVPVSLIHRVIMRESRYNARAVSAGNYGLMQIRLGTARAMGYRGPAEGLLDPATNLTYAVRYLAGAYRAAGANESRAAALYARGYYSEAKRRGLSPYASMQ
jgi:soluble lytic murein transglycosylase-like protein